MNSSPFVPFSTHCAAILHLSGYYHSLVLMRCWIYSSCDTLSLPLFLSLLPPLSLSTSPLLSLLPQPYTLPSTLPLFPPPPFSSFFLPPSSSFFLPPLTSHSSTLSSSRGAFSIVKRVTHIKTAQDYAAKIINTRRLTSRGTNCDVIVMT